MTEMILSDLQQEAVTKCIDMRQRIVAVTGAAGTGKTTITRMVYEALVENGVSCVLCAPTGKAAKRIQEATGIPAMTIHRLLEYPYPGEIDPKTGKPLVVGDPKRCRMYPLEQEVVLCDEYAMVNWEVHKNLLAALPRGGCIRMFGDLAQLPPIEENKLLAAKPSPFAKMLDDFTSVTLDRVFRQGEDSGILYNASCILHGRIPKRLPDFTMQITDRPIEALEDAIFGDNGASYQSVHNQIITPSKKSWVGSYKLNHHLQQIFRPDSTINGIKLPRHQWETNMPVWIDVGDKVVWNQNTYDLRDYLDRFEDESCQKYIYPEPEQMILNGETGIVTEIVREGDDAGSFTIDVGDRLVHIPAKIVEYSRRSQRLVDVDLRTRCALAYALTTHKAQGSEYQNVIYILNKSMMSLLCRHNLYTAVTRARKTVHIISDMRGIQTSVMRKEALI